MLEEKFVDSFLTGTDYKKCLPEIEILAEAVERLKWKGFQSTHKTFKKKEVVLLLNKFAEFLLRKEVEKSVHFKHLCSQLFTSKYEKYTEVSEKNSKVSEMCHYLEGIVRSCILMKNLMAAERRTNCKAHN